jgi:molybdopterin synthase catalytic subunit
MNTIRIQTGDFDVGAEIARLKSTGDVGAVVTFTGAVRRDGDIRSLTLEHYPGMTEREIARHVTEACSRWPIAGATVIHRIGKLAPGDNIVLVAVASAHREAAFAAAEFLMDYLKTRAPFWKLEEEGSGTSRWVEARTVDDETVSRWRED